MKFGRIPPLAALALLSTAAWAQPHFLIQEVRLIGGDNLPSDHEQVSLVITLMNDGDSANDVAVHVDLIDGTQFISAIVQSDGDLGAMASGESKDNVNNPFQFVTAFYQTEAAATFDLTISTDDGTQQTLHLDPMKTLLGLRGGFPGFSTYLGIPHRFQGDTLVHYQNEQPFQPCKIYVTDLQTYTATRLSLVDSNQLVPDIDGTKVVWNDNRFRPIGSDVMFKDLSQGDEIRLSSLASLPSFPRIAGDYVVWQGDHFDLTTQIYLFTLSKGEERPITSFPSQKIFPRISGTRVIWADNRYQAEDIYDIYTYDLVANQESAVPTIPFSITVDGFLEIYGNNLVYGTYDIPHIFYLYNFATGTTTPIVTPGFVWGAVTISGGTLVWAESATFDAPAHVMVYDIASGSRQQITTESSNRGQRDPVIFGNRIVWVDYRLGFTGYWLTNWR